jgi:flagellar basal body-associated protein FliL
MKTKLIYAVIGLLIVLAPLIILALHYNNRAEKFSNERKSAMLQYLSTYEPTKEDFAASQGGALVQLATSHVASEEEMEENLKAEKQQTVRDILNMTEPESFPGPRPATH